VRDRGHWPSQKAARGPLTHAVVVSWVNGRFVVESNESACWQYEAARSFDAAQGPTTTDIDRVSCHACQRVIRRFAMLRNGMIALEREKEKAT